MLARRAWIPGLVLVPALALALAGCGGGSDGGGDWEPSRPNGTYNPSAGGADPSAAASAGASTSATASPVPASAGATVTGASLSQRITSAAATAKSASFTILGTGPQPTSADGVTSGTGKSLQLKMQATVSSMSKVEIIKKDGIIYLKPPTPMAQDKPWLRITESEKDPYRQFYTTLFASLEASGDVSATAAVIGQMSSFTTGATEDVGGVQCTKYSAKPPAATVAKLMPSSYQQLGAATLKASTSEVSVWVGDTGLLCRVGATLKLPKTTSDQIARQVVTYTNWGKAITVTPPPASQLVAPA